MEPKKKINLNFNVVITDQTKLPRLCMRSTQTEQTTLNATLVKDDVSKSYDKYMRMCTNLASNYCKNVLSNYLWFWLFFF